MHQAGDPSSCVNALQGIGPEPEQANFDASLIGKCGPGQDTQPCRDALQAAGLSPDLAAQAEQISAAGCQRTDSFTACKKAIAGADLPATLKDKLADAAKTLSRPDYAWTDLTYLLHKHSVPWAYYVFSGTEP
ncbi:MAG: phospholipase, partial [Actinomycetes bacterium]